MSRVKVLCMMSGCIYCDDNGEDKGVERFTCGNDEITISMGKNGQPECEEYELDTD